MQLFIIIMKFAIIPDVSDSDSHFMSEIFLFRSIHGSRIGILLDHSNGSKIIRYHYFSWLIELHYHSKPQSDRTENK